MQADVLVENVTKRFGLTKPHGVVQFLRNYYQDKNARKLVALDNISFNVPRGEMLGIIGMNGSGKTTLLRIIAGIYLPDKGKVSVNGRLAPMLHIGTGFHNELVASENIILSGMLYGLSKSEISQKVEKIIELAELQEFSEMKFKYYSSGMKARLAFSTAVQIDPEILLVDEILSVGDLAFRKKSYKMFLSLKEKGRTILYSTHNLSTLPQLCDRVLLLHNGKMINIGPPNEIIEQYKELVKQKE